MLPLLCILALLQDPTPAQPAPVEAAPAQSVAPVQQAAPAAQAAPAPAAPQIVAGSTWATAGSEHTLFACRDVNNDGFEDLVVATPDKRLLVSESVQGWKAAPWKDLAASAWPGGFDAFAQAAAATTASARVPSPPPYQPELQPVRTFQGDLNGDKLPDTIAIYHCTRPGDYLELRVAFALGANPDDLDGDGLPNSQEIAIGSDPEDRDSDGDGLLDGWEVLGLPRGIPAGEKTQLDPRRQDVIIAVSPYDGVDRNALAGELERAAKLYRDLPTKNRDGSTGIQLSFRLDPSVPPDNQFGGDWRACGNALFPLRQRGVLHWMQVTPWGGGQSQQTGDMGGSGAGFAVFAHEFGHQMSLPHEGDSAAAWCPLYPSLMNYAFGYQLGGDGNAIRFSDGRFRSVVLDERALVEKLPFPYADLKYLEAGPFRFTLKENGPNETLIDWNQDGRFDDKPVVADVNYGGSTYCGTRREMGVVGAAPQLACVGDTCFLASLDGAQSAISLRAYQGNEKWGDPRAVPNSATNYDPLLIGGKDKGYLLFKRELGWYAARFDATTIDAPVAIADLPDAELGGGPVGGRVLLVTRHDDDSLRTWWLECDGKQARVVRGQELELHSKQPVGFAEEPGTGRIAVASSMTNSKGVPLCLRVSWYRVAGDRLVEDELRWVRGEGSGTNCTTRPVVVYDPQGQLDVFHTGMPDAGGLMTGWRTRRIGNQALDEGWLTCMLYDVWTLTRRAVAFANGPQGAIYAFRWDAGGGWNTTLLVAHDGFGIDAGPMRDFDDGAKMAQHGIVHSILWMQPDPAQTQ